MQFVPAPEYPVFPTQERPLQPYEAVVRATAETRPAIAQAAPDLVVHDILTLAPALAAELEGVATATLIPHVYPVGARGFPPYALGARIPRTPSAGPLWRAFEWPVERGTAPGPRRAERDAGEAGPAAGRAAPRRPQRALCLVGDLPPARVPAALASHVHVVGPLLWEPPFEEVEPPPGDEPLVLVAPSTAQDPEPAAPRGARGAARASRARAGDLEPQAARPAPIGVPRTPAWSTGSPTRARCRGRARDLPCGPRDDRPRAQPAACRCSPCRHSGDMAENAARARLGGRRRAAAVAAAQPAAAAPGGSPGAG